VAAGSVEDSLWIDFYVLVILLSKKLVCKC